MIVKLSLIFLSVVLTSCTLFLKRVDEDFSGHKSNLTFRTDTKTYCQGSTYMQLVSESEKNQVEFHNFINDVKKIVQLGFVDQLVLWSLIQMNVRPDQASPTSKLSLLINDNGQEVFYTFYGMGPETHSYILGLEYLLKKYNSKNSLIALGRLVDRHYPDSVFVSKYFEEFLQAYQSQLSDNAALKQAFMRGGETLRAGERLPKQNFVTTIQNGLKSRRDQFKVETSLIRYQYNLATSISCNFDLSLYKDNVFLINPEIIRSNIFGIKRGSHSALVSSGQKFDKLLPMADQYFFTGHSNTRSATLCSISNKNLPQRKLWVSSTQSRDPGQHIFHLLEYGIGSASTLEEIDKLIRFSRHLFLKNPLRLIYESDRSLKSQTEELLKLQIPIYSANRLGQVWANLAGRKQAGFVIDDRNESALTCIK